MTRGISKPLKDEDRLPDVILIPLLVKYIETVVRQFESEVVELMLNHLDSLLDDVSKQLDLVISAQMEQEWKEYKHHVEKLINKQIDEYLRKTNVSLYYTSDTKYDIIYSEVVEKFYNSKGGSTRGLAGQLLRVYRTETTRGQSIVMDMMFRQNPNLRKVWVYTYESKTRREHHHAHDGIRADDGGYFTINGKKTLGAGLFNDPKEDINCKCRIGLLVDEP